MYKITKPYEDFDGNQRTEDFYFHFTEAELADLQYSKNGGFNNYVNKIMAAGDEKSKIEIFRQLIDMSYGQKSLDGRTFKKSKEILEDFKSTQAYSDIYMTLGTDDKAAVEFINNVLPKSIRDKNTPAA